MAIRDISRWPEEWKQRFRERNGFIVPKPPPPVARLRLYAGIPERAWVNQPSTLQPYHKLHGREVLAIQMRWGEVIIYFLEGNVISQSIDPSALSAGWPRRET